MTEHANSFDFGRLLVAAVVGSFIVAAIITGAIAINGEPEVAVVPTATVTSTPRPTNTPTITPTPAPTDTPAPTNTPAPTSEEPTEAPEDVGFSGDPERGRILFEEFQPAASFACMTCHLVDTEAMLIGPGLQNIGQRAETRVDGMSAYDYLYTSIVNPNDFVVDGFTPDLMPQMYSEIFSEEDINNIIAYLNTLGTGTDTLSASNEVAENTSASETTVEQTSPHDLDQGFDPALVSMGEIHYITCSACHGFDLLGIPGLGKSLIDSEFVNGKSNEELVHFIRIGRAIDDPLNTTGIEMPASGANPGLTDGDLMAVVHFIRSKNAS